jgi:sRNA-binding protein
MSRRDYVGTAVAVIEILATAFPKTFAVYQRRRVPLMVGVRDEIMRRLGDAAPFTEEELGAALPPTNTCTPVPITSVGGLI